MRKTVCSAITLRRALPLAVSLLFSVTLLAGPSAVPRKSPEFAISDASGKTTLLSSLKGKVVVMEFLFMNSEHCVRVAKTLNNLQAELGQRGLQSIGVVFGPNADEQHVVYMTDYLKLAYPVGFTTSLKVDSYLGRTGNEILSIPQVVVIDRAGMIRATSGGRRGDPNLEDQNYLRGLIDSLLKEDLPAPTAKRTPAPR